MYEAPLDGDRAVVLVLSTADRPVVFYPSSERWWEVTLIGPRGVVRQFWGEYTSPERWRRLP